MSSFCFDDENCFSFYSTTGLKFLNVCVGPLGDDLSGLIGQAVRSLGLVAFMSVYMLCECLVPREVRRRFTDAFKKS